jgi:uncharacterized LabA/DUF88 family protein
LETKERVAIFIDGSNLYHSLEENCSRADLDFNAFIAKLTKGRHLYRAYYYNILQDPERRGTGYQEQQKFLASLYAVPRLEVRLGTSKYRGEQLVEKGVDIMLATDLLQFAWENRYDVAVLVSGDGDFSYAVQKVKNLGKHVEVAAFSANLSSDLAHVCDDRHAFDRDYFYELWVTARKSQPPPQQQAGPPSGPPSPSGGGGGGGGRRRRFRGRRGGGGGGQGPPPQQPGGQGPPPQLGNDRPPGQPEPF